MLLANRCPIRLLVDHGAAVDAGNIFGETQLKLAMKTVPTRYDVAEQLVKLHVGADPKQWCDLGKKMNILHLMVRHTGGMKLLLDHGAYPNILNWRGETPLRIAIRWT